MDDYYSPYDEEYNESQGPISRLYTTSQWLTSRLLHRTTSVLLMPFIGVKDTLQWLIFTIDISDDTFQYWFLCSRNGCQGVYLVLITLLVSCIVFGVILYLILDKRDKSVKHFLSRTTMVTTSTQVDDYIQPTLDIISTRQLSESRIDSITDDNTSHNVRLFSNIADTNQPTKAYRRTISFSQDVDIKPANKKRRIPVVDKTGQTSPRKSSMSASSVSISARNKPSSSFLNFKKRLTVPNKSPVRPSGSKISNSNKSTERVKSPFNNVGPRKSKTKLLKTYRQNSTMKSSKSKSGPLFQGDQKYNKFVFSRMNSSILSPKKTNSSNRNKTIHAQSQSASSKSEGWLQNKRSHETNLKLLKKKPNREKSFYNSKFNEDAYLIDHERPRGIGTNSLFSNSRSAVLYPNHLIRPHATREQDKHCPATDFHPPRKTDTPEIKSFKGQGAFTPMFKDQFEKNASWCNNSKQFHTAGNSYEESGMKCFKSDKLMFNNTISNNNIDVKSIKELSHLRQVTSVGDTNLNSLRSICLSKVAHQNKTDNSSSRPFGSEDLKQAFSLSRCDKYNTNKHLDVKLTEVQGARKENLNFMLSSRPKTSNRWRHRGVSAGHKVVKSLVKSDLSSSSSSRSRSAKSNRKRSEHLSTTCIRHALENGLVKTRHPFKHNHRPTAKHSKQRSSSAQPIKFQYDKHARHEDQVSKNRRTKYDNNNVCEDLKRSEQKLTSMEQNLGSQKLFPRISCKCTAASDPDAKTSSSNEDTKSETCRFCARVSRPLTSHRHRPYEMRTARCTKGLKGLDKNNCSPSKNRHFFLATKDDDATSVDSDCPEMNVKLNAGTDSRHIFIPGLVATKNKGIYSYCGNNSENKSCHPLKVPRTKNSSSKDIGCHKLVSSKCGDDKSLGPKRSYNDIKPFSTKGDNLPEIDFSGSYTDYLKFCRAKKSILANSSKDIGNYNNVDEQSLHFTGITNELFNGENISYSNFLRHCYELENLEKTSTDVRCNSEKEKSDKLCLKSVQVQTSPKLDSSKSGFSKTKSSISHSSVPKYVYNRFNRPKIFKPRYQKCKSNTKKINNKHKLSYLQIKDKDKERTNGERKEAEDKDLSEANNTYSKESPGSNDQCHVSKNDHGNLRHRENNKYIKKTTPNLCDHDDRRLEREVKSTDEGGSEDTLSSLNETYIIENGVKDFKRPIASPRKSLSPQLAERFMQRPLWQNADVNELDRRVQRALKLREELQLRKHSKDNTPTTIHLIQQIEEGLKKGDTAETCTEDLRPSDTDEIPSCQLDTTLNFDENLSLCKAANTSILSEKDFRAENNSSRSTTTTVVLNDNSCSEESWQDNVKSNELLDKVLFGDSTERIKQNQSHFNLGTSNKVEQINTTFTDNTEHANSLSCLEILSDDLNKLQKRQQRRCSLNVTAKQSSNSINTISMLTDSDVVTKDNSKKNTPPIKIGKYDNETTKNSLRLIGALVDSLPKVPTKSMVDWFLATSDPRDFDSISKSGLSSNSSENGNVLGAGTSKYQVQDTICPSKQSPFPKSRMKSSFKDKDESKPCTSYVLPSHTAECTTNQPDRDVDKLNCSWSNEKETGKRAPSKRFPRTRERRILAKSDHLTKMHDSDKPPHAKKENNKENILAPYSDQPLNMDRKYKPQSQMFSSRSKKKEELKEYSRPNSSGKSSGYARSVSRQRKPDRQPARAQSQPPDLSVAHSQSHAELPDDEASPLGVQQIIMKFRQRHETMSPTDSQPDQYRIRIKKKSDVKGIIAKFSNR